MTKLTKRVVIGAVAAVCLAAAVAYVLAGSTPRRYRPLRLDGQQRQAAAKRFYRHMMDIDDAAQTGEVFSVHITADQINRYLASADEIAAMLPDGQPGRVQEMMDAADFRGPAVAIDQGTLTLMARAGEGGRVVSIELSAWVDRGGLLHVALEGVSVGRLPVPAFLVRGHLVKVRGGLLERLTIQLGEREVPSGAEADLAGRAAEYAAKAVLAALDGRAVVPEGRWRHRRLRLAGIEGSEGELILYVAPVPKAKAAGQSASSQVSIQSSGPGPDRRR